MGLGGWGGRRRPHRRRRMQRPNCEHGRPSASVWVGGWVGGWGVGGARVGWWVGGWVGRPSKLGTLFIIATNLHHYIYSIAS